jgi:hypothetical protein
VDSRPGQFTRFRIVFPKITGDVEANPDPEADSVLDLSTGPV